MTTEELRKEIIYQYMSAWAYRGWKIQPDGIVDTEGTVRIRNYPYPKLPFKFGKVGGNFDCSENKLETLENGPDIVAGSYWCERNELKTIEHAAKQIGEMFVCHSNAVKFTEADVKKYTNKRSKFRV